MKQLIIFDNMILNFLPLFIPIMHYALKQQNVNLYLLLKGNTTVIKWG